MRIVPINTEVPKGLLEVKGEPLIERIIKQLHEVFGKYWKMSGNVIMFLWLQCVWIVLKLSKKEFGEDVIFCVDRERLPLAEMLKQAA